jgi:hypothetical protein
MPVDAKGESCASRAGSIPAVFAAAISAVNGSPRSSAERRPAAISA